MLRAAALQAGLLGPGMVGLTLGHAIFICRGHKTRRLLSHELRHVHQYEQHGSIAAFLPVYLGQIVEAVSKSKGDLALVSAISSRTPWWTELEANGAPKIIARLPFLERADHPAALPVFLISRVADDATAYAHRQSRIMVNVAAFYAGPADREVKQEWVERFAAELNQGDAGAYVNFLMDEGVGVRVLTLYAFSAENWKRRPRGEVDFLMQLLRQYLKQEVPRLNRNNVRLGYIGRIHELPDKVQDRLRWAEEATAGNTGMVLTLALNYGARAEIVDAFRTMVEVARNNGGVDHLVIDEETVSRHLYGDLPDPDLVIRTSGELRVSNFLLWQIAYSEIYVTGKLWPDFDGTDLLHAIADYQGRERRYGGRARRR